MGSEIETNYEQADYLENLVEYGPTRNLEDLLATPLKGDRLVAAQIMDAMGLREKEKVDFFKYFIWQQEGGKGLKEFGEVREESFVSLRNRINDDNLQTQAYNFFYTNFQEMVLIRLMIRGVNITDATEDTEIPLERAMKLRWAAIESGSLRPYVLAEDKEEIKNILDEIGSLDFSTHNRRGQKADLRLRIAIGELELSGMTHMDIAKTLGVPSHTVRNYLDYLKKNTRFEQRTQRERNEKKANLLNLVNEFVTLNPGKPVSLWFFIRDGRTTSDYRLLIKLYKELAEVEDLPPLSVKQNSPNR